MVLLAATRLQQLLSSKPPQEVAEFNDLVVYGCQFSPVHSLKLLKLSIDFNKRSIRFYKLFHLDPCPASGAYLDMVLDYVFRILKM